MLVKQLERRQRGIGQVFKQLHLPFALDARRF